MEYSVGSSKALLLLYRGQLYSWQGSCICSSLFVFQFCHQGSRLLYPKCGELRFCSALLGGPLGRGLSPPYFCLVLGGYTRGQLPPCQLPEGVYYLVFKSLISLAHILIISVDFFRVYLAKALLTNKTLKWLCLGCKKMPKNSEGAIKTSSSTASKRAPTWQSYSLAYSYVKWGLVLKHLMSSFSQRSQNSLAL